MYNPKYFFQGVVLTLAVFANANEARATFYKIGDGGLQSGWNLNIDGTVDGGGNALVGGIKLTPVVGAVITSVCLDIQGTVYLGSSYDFVVKSFQGQDGLNPNWGYGNGPGNSVLTAAQKIVASAAIQNAAFVFSQHKSVLSGGTTTDTGRNLTFIAEVDNVPYK